jgi:hypothetical protein
MLREREQASVLVPSAVIVALLVGIVGWWRWTGSDDAARREAQAACTAVLSEESDFPADPLFLRDGPDLHQRGDAWFVEGYVTERNAPEPSRPIWFVQCQAEPTGDHSWQVTELHLSRQR